jgi:hypothetical protein
VVNFWTASFGRKTASTVAAKQVQNKSDSWLGITYDESAKKSSHSTQHFPYM